MQSSKYLSVLKQNKLSDTATRRQLFEIIQTQNEPYPITKLVDLASQKMNKSSVYRTVNTFEKAGIIKKVYSGWKESVELSDLFNNHHHHMTCIKCSKIIAFNEPEVLVEELLEITKKYSFYPTTHSIEFYGVCADCI